MLKGVITVNDQQYDRIAAKIVRTLPTSPRDAIVGVWGLTFKAQTDDLRDSPSIEICKRLLDIGVQLRAYDPTVTTAPPALDSEGFSVVGSAAEAAVGAHVLAVLTEWDEFRWVPPSEVAAVMETHAVVDARNILEKPEWTRAGFDYQGVGR
jgi:UDPglucose 6-dehydrogenase